MVELQQLLNQAEDIVILEKHPDENRYRFAVPFRGDFARKCYEASSKLDAGLPEFQGYWKFNEQTKQINGLNIPLLIRLMKVLNPERLELPDTLDLLELERRQRLKTGVYYDSGIAVYNDEHPNKETARVLIEKGKQEGWKLPLLYGFRDLDYEVDSGVKVISINNPRRVVSGKRAEDILKGFYYHGNSGAQGVYRYWYGIWLAGWYDFVLSLSDGLVGFVCAEGTRENLREGYDNLFARKYNAEREALQRQIADLDIERAREEAKVLDALKV